MNSTLYRTARSRARTLAVTFAVAITLVCSVASAAVGDNAVGICVHDGRPTFIAAAADLGLGWVRVDGNWFQLEPAEGVYDWWLDTPVQNATAAGLEVFITLAYTPDWATRYGDTDGNANNDIPDATQWAAFVDAAVRHYRPMGVTHFGLWNEANLSGFFEGDAQQYVDFVVVPGAAAVRAACSDCKVLGPDLANVGDVDVFLEAVLTAMPAGSFDIITHHIYNGFPELGTAVWDGDRYFNVLDEPRIPGFTRRPIRELLDQAGYAGEVWITETGYRATPGDTGKEDKQATYIGLALDQQLSRDWVTNTFIYEVHDCGPDQPTCDIDGFGVMRAQSGAAGARQFPTDFRLKPAYDALEQYVASHSEFDEVPPVTQCNDGLDNDNDGAVDLADRGCVSPGDDAENDDTTRVEIIATRNNAIALDGDLSEFGDEGWVTLAYPNAWAGVDVDVTPADCSARAAVRWSAGALYVGIEVTDDVHDNALAPELLWQGDSVQLAFDLGQSGGTGYDGLDDHEITFALANGAVSSFRFHGPNGATDDFDAAIVRDDLAGTTSYELTLSGAALPGFAFTSGSVIGFSFLTNEADGDGRTGWLQWSSGIGNAKIPREFGQIVFADAPPPPVDDVEVADVSSDTWSGDAADDTASAPTPDTGADELDALQSDVSGETEDAIHPLPTGGGDDGGCGCRVHRTERSSLPMGLGVLALVALLVRTRRFS